MLSIGPFGKVGLIGLMSIFELFLIPEVVLGEHNYNGRGRKNVYNCGEVCDKCRDNPGHSGCSEATNDCGCPEGMTGKTHGGKHGDWTAMVPIFVWMGIVIVWWVSRAIYQCYFEEKMRNTEPGRIITTAPPPFIISGNGATGSGSNLANIIAIANNRGADAINNGHPSQTLQTSTIPGPLPFVLPREGLANELDLPPPEYVPPPEYNDCVVNMKA